METRIAVHKARNAAVESVQAPVRQTTYTRSVIIMLAFRTSTGDQRAGPGRTRLCQVGGHVCCSLTHCSRASGSGLDSIFSCAGDHPTSPPSQPATRNHITSATVELETTAGSRRASLNASTELGASSSGTQNTRLSLSINVLVREATSRN
jgi:hypothetical protein